MPAARRFSTTVSMVAKLSSLQPSSTMQLQELLITSGASSGVGLSPPKSVGGKMVALTCVRCNTITGSPLEAELKRHTQLVDLYEGTSQDWITAAFGVRGGTTTVNALARRVEGGTFEIVGDPRHNDPAVTAIHNVENEAMVAGPVPDQGWTISHPDHAYTPANVAAALSTTGYGAVAPIPDAQAVMARLAESVSVIGG